MAATTQEDNNSASLILITEDDPSTRAMISLLLQKTGYQTIQACDGQQALSLLEGMMPDLIISDISMPFMDGFELFRQVRARDELSQIPFIFLSGKSEARDMRRGMSLGADDYITKPFEPQDLLTAVQIRLARASQARAVVDRLTVDLQKQVLQALVHEFRTPLSLVVGYTDLLESTGHQMAEGEFRAILQGLHVGSKRLIDLVESFLLLSRLQAGEVSREIHRRSPQTVGPDQVVRQVVVEFREQAAARNVTLVAGTHTPAAVIAVDPEHLLEIICRLTDNAIKFSRESGGQVTLTTRRDGAFWALDVADQGIGIRPEARDWIFEAFRQVDRGRMEQQGPGIGLTIVQELVRIYAGRVAMESIPDEGSTFSVWLPLVAEPG